MRLSCTWISLVRALTVLTFVTPGVFAYTPMRAHAEGTLVGSIAASQRSDVLFDDARGLLYMTVADRVLRYDVVTGKFLSPFVLGGRLAGMDISPDGAELAVADLAISGDPYAPGVNWVHVVDLETGATRQFFFERYFGEAGTWMVAYGNDGRLLLSTRFAGSGWTPLRRLDPLQGTATMLGTVEQDTALESSGDRTIIGFAEINISSGDWGIYRVASGELVRRQTRVQNREITVNRDGTQYAVPLTALRIYDSALNNTFSIGAPTGAQYSPTADVVYVPTAGTQDVVAYETTTYREVARYDLESPFALHGWISQSFGFPRLAVCKDNALLVSTVSNGVRQLWMKPVVTGTVRSSFADTPVEGACVELWSESSGEWTLEATVSAGVGGSWHYAPPTAHPLRVRVIDPTSAHAATWYAGADVESATSLTPTRSPEPIAVAVPIVAPSTIVGRVTDAWDSLPIEGIEVTLYREAYEREAVRSTTTGAAGSFAFTGLSPGRYFVEYVDPVGDHEAAFFDECYGLDDATLIRIEGPGETRADQVLLPVPMAYVEVAGADRYATAVESSRRSFPEGADAVIVATGENWPDALGGAALAGVYGAPILLTRSGQLPAVVADEIARLQPNTVLILGGAGAVSTAVQTRIASLAPKANVERFAGTDRFDTTRRIAAGVIDDSVMFDGTAFVATGGSFPDALAAAPLATALERPLYLVGADGISAATLVSMRTAGVTDVVILGGPGAVPATVESQLDAAGLTHTRVAGENRYATALKVAEFGVDAGLWWDGAGLSSGISFPDALAGGVMQGHDGSVLLLTRPDAVDRGVAAALAANRGAITEFRFIGGASAVSTSVRNAVRDLLRDERLAE